MKTVLFVVTSLEVGGIETYLMRFLAYAKGRIRPLILCKSGLGGHLVPTAEALGAKVILMDLGTLASTRHAALYRMLRREKVDCVCDFTGDFAGTVMLTSWMAGVPKRISFYRESEYQFSRTPARLLVARQLGRLVARCSTDILANSETALDNFQAAWRVDSQRFAVIRNPGPMVSPLGRPERTEVRARLGVPDHAFMVVATGRAVPAKNHATILAAAEAMIHADRTVVFVLCGRGLTSAFGPRVAASPVGANILLFDHRDDVLDVVGAADAFFFPSLNEGMPNALIEAMTLGIPCVASNIPPVQEIFPPDYKEFLVGPEDVDSYIRLLRRVGSEPMETYSHALRTWANKEFSQESKFGALLSRFAA